MANVTKTNILQIFWGFQVLVAKCVPESPTIRFATAIYCEMGKSADRVEIMDVVN